VLWVVPNTVRQKALQAALAADKTIQAELFQVITTDQFTRHVSGQQITQPNEATP
jgi:hypothetical protein